MRFPAGETVTVLRAPLVPDRYGSQVRDWDSPARTSYDGCAVANWARGRVSEVHADGRDPVVSDLIIYMPPGADVAAADRLEVRGEVYELVGEPFGWSNPLTGTVFGVAVNCDRVEG
ncbi:hypothetical protein ACFY05_42020 [Microtetraspora fusca]|uniref:Head-tail adaptor protein n=1 Tax=Microtetraspora fusca TaxID=1997 RepID=A0ABW6VKB6_MICFU